MRGEERFSAPQRACALQQSPCHEPAPTAMAQAGLSLRQTVQGCSDDGSVCTYSLSLGVDRN